MAIVRDLIILLPGITGSVLANRHGKEVWAPSVGALWRAASSRGNSISALELADDAATDGVTATRLVDDVTIAPGLVKIDGYSHIRQFLTTELGLANGKNFHAFPYDWRLDNRISAKQLQSWAMDRLKQWREQSGARDARLTLIAHSMGGLVARYFVECLGGWADTRFLITIGTPHRGSLNAVDFLCHGMKLGIGPLGIDLSPLLRSYTSVYQLLPIYPCVGMAGGTLQSIAHAAEAGLLPQVDAQRARAAMSFHDEIFTQQERNARDDAYRDRGYRTVPIVGIDQPTSQSATVSGGKLTLIRGLLDNDEAGDGTVPQGSATPLELEHDFLEHYTAEKHGALQNARSVRETIKGILKRPNFDRMRPHATRDGLTSLTLDVEDAIIAPEPLTVRVRPVGAQLGVQVLLEPLSGGKPVESALARGWDGWQIGEFALAPGIWRVTASAHPASPVHDLVVVAEK